MKHYFFPGRQAAKQIQTASRPKYFFSKSYYLC